MKHELSALPYPLDGLEPHISKETLEFHYNKHHSGYVKKLNAQVDITPAYSHMSLEEIIKTTQPGDGAFNNAAQIWNHTFYWNSMCPNGAAVDNGDLAKQIEKDFGGMGELKKKFVDAAKGNFGSGWTWLCADEDGSLQIINTDDADTVIRTNKKPLIVCDIWEHAYYIDYRNDRGEYLNNFWELINWDFAEKNFHNTK